jgi:hypothetical protein
VNLFDVPKAPRHRRRGSRALVLLDQAKCICCLGPLEIVTCDQPARFMHGGYGYTIRETHHNCHACAKSRKVLSAAISPLGVFA